jgi:hypothetical protein
MTKRSQYVPVGSQYGAHQKTLKNKRLSQWSQWSQYLYRGCGGKKRGDVHAYALQEKSGTYWAYWDKRAETPAERVWRRSPGTCPSMLSARMQLTAAAQDAFRRRASVAEAYALRHRPTSSRGFAAALPSASHRSNRTRPKNPVLSVAP